jgi:2-polyprenyl-6-methoxyphenol hydroxylase-like FAD-dependent oxidoreductase
MPVEKVLVVGGGLAGMTLATALARTGVRAEIVEISQQWSALGVGISLQGPTLRALKTLGALGACVERGFGYSSVITCDVAGKVTGQVDLPKLNGPDYPATLGILRPILNAILVEGVEVAGVPVGFGVTVQSIEYEADQVAVTLTDGSRGRYDLVVGADGANSKMRELLFGAAVRPEMTGQAVWRATVPRPPEVRARYSFYGPRNKCGFNPVSQREMYVYLVENMSPERRHNPRIPDDKLVATMHEQLEDFGGLVAEARAHIQDPARIVYRPIGSLLLPRPWHRGRVLLMGDAAHTATPQLPSGAGIAIEDAIVLAELLSQGLDAPAFFDTFMTRRFERCRMVVENSRQLGEWEKTPDAPDADPVGLMNRSFAALAEPV